MKSSLGTVFAAVLAVGALPAEAQFSGKLVYSNGLTDYPLTITYYQRGNLGRVDEQEINMGDDNKPDRAHPQIADTLLYNFSAGTRTILRTSLQFAVTVLSASEDARLALPTDSNIVVVNKGKEKVNGYNCTHFHIGSTGRKIRFSHDEDLWITKDLGIPGLMVFAKINYYTRDHIIMKKLLAAGGAGVLVQMMHTGTTRPGIRLVSADRNAPPPSAFQVPAGYKPLDATKVGIP
jgi:hypothetical protein